VKQSEPEPQLTKEEIKKKEAEEKYKEEYRRK
jgi:hypothetical protein